MAYLYSFIISLLRFKVKHCFIKVCKIFSDFPPENLFVRIRFIIGKSALVLIACWLYYNYNTKFAACQAAAKIFFKKYLTFMI